jgi:DnaJ-class molecular chaperone
MSRWAPAGWIAGRDYMCGECIGRGTVWCDECGGLGHSFVHVAGGWSRTKECKPCGGGGRVTCPDCRGDAEKVQPPDWR